MKHKLTVIGLGPGSKEYLTIGAFEKMKVSKKVFLRTEKHPVVDYLKEQEISYESFDAIYEQKENFDEVYKAIVENLLTMVESEDVVYAVPGSPFVAEVTVQILIDRAKTQGFILEFVPSVSFIEAIFHTLKKDPIGGLKIIDGLQLDKQAPDVETDVIVTQVYNKFVASEMKLKLMEYYPDEYPIVVIRGAGIPHVEKVQAMKLYELDRVEWLDYLTSIYIPKFGEDMIASYSMNDLIKIMKKLRGKGGCPWDAKQTHESLKPHLIEETYEVLEALDEMDMTLLEEELGDLLLQIVFHALLASERDKFSMKDVVKGICKKLVDRHPHVFGEITVDSAAGAVKSWEAVKREEKNVKTYTEGLKRVPKHLPALMKSYKIQAKAAEVGFDWDHVEDAIEKVREELGELLEVYNTGERVKIKEELGDLIFSVVNVARFLKVDPELALNVTIKKFIHRFEFIETTAEKNGEKLEEMSLKEMDELWNMAKIHKK
ncbi:bifunctional methyltransferase/pyrophosphohydrolase YabN [Marinisporobacter balticus]|uniref:Tetrapyrrole methylase family protein/MazG family protein n=1 Tax=Marinisporobacter balticus TaxID=2018667 RepID=A0A4R2KXF4_9FIRM|nr:nucleoside triphosphate pyrophosphohydrolase [Marinisporobacter balticus]TCO71365.1 tetrapyrrole methylase family protein/MazG family protein [Marinisporobacter balticus]